MALWPYLCGNSKLPNMDEFPVSSGVPQGSVLGLLLFLLYIDDITQNIESDICLSADDALLYRNVENGDDAFVFQRDKQNIFNWSKR